MRPFIQLNRPILPPLPTLLTIPFSLSPHGPLFPLSLHFKLHTRPSPFPPPTPPLYRMCALYINVFSIECVLYRVCHRFHLLPILVFNLCLCLLRCAAPPLNL